MKASHGRKPRLFEVPILTIALTSAGLPPRLQEVVSHFKKLTKKNKEQLSGMMVLDKQKGLKSLSKEKRQKLEAYQHLFYLLQVSRGPRQPLEAFLSLHGVLSPTLMP